MMKEKHNIMNSSFTFISRYCTYCVDLRLKTALSHREVTMIQCNFKLFIGDFLEVSIELK